MWSWTHVPLAASDTNLTSTTVCNLSAFHLPLASPGLLRLLTTNHQFNQQLTKFMTHKASTDAWRNQWRDHYCYYCNCCKFYYKLGQTLRQPNLWVAHCKMGGNGSILASGTRGGIMSIRLGPICLQSDVSCKNSRFWKQTWCSIMQCQSEWLC